MPALEQPKRGITGAADFMLEKDVARGQGYFALAAHGIRGGCRLGSLQNALQNEKMRACGVPGSVL